MNHSLYRLYSKIHNTPHLITPEAFNVILDYLETRNSDGYQMATKRSPLPDGSFDVVSENTSGDIGVIAIDGSLTYKPVMTLCGEAGTSYQSLVAQVEEMAEAGVKTIVMEVSSGGGEASHVFEAAEDIRAICDEQGIQLIGYADTMACSAAYALICICDEVIANPSADLGSIGCVVALLDQSKALEQAGYKRIFVTSGDNKVPFADDGSFKQEFLDEIQADVNRLNEQFAAHVSQYTGLSVETIMDFQASVYDANKAVELGLANKVMTNKQFAQYVANLHKGT
jgi:ClpP class serine protease